MNNYTNKALGLFVVAALAAMVIPAGNAQTSSTGFGSVVSEGNADTTVVLTAAAGGAFCFVDDDGSGTFNTGEPVYLNLAGCGAVATNDIRIANPPTGTKGSLVGGSATDNGDTTVAFAGTLDHFDADGDGFLNPGETAYIDSDASGTVTVGDVIVTGSSAGTVATGSTAGMNNALAGVIALAGAFYDTDADGAFTPGDEFYLDDPNGAGTGVGFGSVGDIILSSTGFGTIVTADEKVLTAAAGAAYCFVDDDGSGTFNTGEPVYINLAGCGAVATNDIRIANPPTGTKGSLVGGSATDNGDTTAAFAGALDHFDADGDGFFNPGETAYVDSDGSGTVTVGDVIVTGSTAGTVATGSTSGMNNALAGVVALTLAFWDGDSDGVYSPGDIMYVDDPNGAGTGVLFASIADIRLSGALPSSTSSTSQSGSQSQTDTNSTVSSSTSGSLSGSVSTSPSGSVSSSASGSETDDGDNSTPGFELVALVAALAVALVLVRRKL